MKNRAIILTAGVAAIMLVVGVAIGSVAFPTIKTETMRQPTTTTATQTVVSMVTQTQSILTGETTYTENITYELMSTIAESSSVCTITGQPDGMFLRILSDSSHAPVAGAEVMATNSPAFCGSYPANNQSTEIFTTNNSEWYSFNGWNNVGYSFAVRYSGQSYNFTAHLAPVSLTCATLLLPSGRTNVTILAYQSSCQTVTSTITTITITGSQTQQYYVTFQQIGACDPEFWGIPWSVTIGNLTLVQRGTYSISMPALGFVILTNVTTVSNSVTTYYVSAYSAINPSVETLGTSTYMTTTYAYVVVSYMVIGTSVNSNVMPSSLWVVSVCTFAPSS